MSHPTFVDGIILGLGCFLFVMVLIALLSPPTPPPGYGYNRPWWKVLLGIW